MRNLDLQLQKVEQLAIRVSSSEQRLAVLSAKQLARANNSDERSTPTREMVNQQYEMRKAAAKPDVLLRGSAKPARHRSSRPWRARW